MGLTILEKKLKAINFLTYLKILGRLKYYLGFIGYFCNYIHFYAQLAILFQVLKTFLFQDALISGQQQQVYISKTKLKSPTPQEPAFFQNIQKALSHPSTFVHHNSDKTLWIDLDASKKFSFGAVVFYTSFDKTLFKGYWLSNSSVILIFFLSWLLTLAKTNYWPTKLEIISFV